MSTQGARKAGVGVALALPLEVDSALYRQRVSDLKALSDVRLGSHYAAFGRKEGRVASPAGGRSGYFAMSSHNDPARHWAKDSPPAGINPALVGQAPDQIEKAKAGYIDCHAWRMTPASFRQILATLSQLGKSPLRPLRDYDTAQGQDEFFAVLGRES
jgi:hypothetical protein